MWILLRIKGKVKSFWKLLKKNKKKIFAVHCLNLGIASQGKTVEEAMANIKDAIKLYLEENPQETPKTEGLMPPMATRVFLSVWQKMSFWSWCEIKILLRIKGRMRNYWKF